MIRRIVVRRIVGEPGYTDYILLQNVLALAFQKYFLKNAIAIKILRQFFRSFNE